MPTPEFQLPDFLIADLYKNYLVEIDDSFSSLTEDIENEILEVRLITNAVVKHLGENKRNILIFVNDPGAIFINDEELALLVKILKACHLDLSDIAIINLHNQELSFDGLKEQLKPEHVLFFDTEPATVKLPFSIPHFQLQQFAGCRFMTAPSLNYIFLETPKSKLLKSKLWLSLQKTFQLT